MVAADHPRARGGLLRRLLFAGLPLALLVVLLEVACALLGLGSTEAGRSLSRGFDAGAAYLVPDRESPGAWRTQIFGERSDELSIPRRDGRRRVLLLGGSNTQLFPHEVLAEALAPHDPDGRGWEVLNLGRRGYGSERVSILARQALQHLVPDVLVIYAGHNEFVERAFAVEIGEASGPAGTQSRSLGARTRNLLGRLRSFRLLRDVFRPRGTRVPEPHDRAAQLFRNLQAEDTQRFYSAYEENLRIMVEAAGDAGVPVVLCTVVSHMLEPPFVSPAPADLEGQALATFRDWLEAQRARVPARLQPDTSPARRLRVGLWYSQPAPLALDVPVPFTLQAVLADTAARAAPHNAASPAGAHWPDPAGWTSEVAQQVTLHDAVMRRQLEPAEREVLSQIGDDVLPMLQKHPGDPRTTYQAALVTWLLGADDDRARELFQRAMDLDRAPRRGNGETNGRVRRIASEFTHVTLHDAERVFRSATTDGVLAYEVMMDHCHLQPGARVVLMHQLADVLAGLLEDGALR